MSRGGRRHISDALRQVLSSIIYVIFILHQKCYLLLPYFRMPHPLNFTQSMNAIDCFCMLVYTVYNRFNGYSQCTVSYAPFYVCNERSAMTSIKHFKVKVKSIFFPASPIFPIERNIFSCCFYVG